MVVYTIKILHERPLQVNIIFASHYGIVRRLQYAYEKKTETSHRQG